MRVLTSAARSKIAKRTATEPIIVVEITWKTGSIRRYAEKKHQNAAGKILEISSFESTKKLKGGQSTSINLLLDDTDDEIKDLLKNSDPHESSAVVYQSYQGLSTSSNFVLFKGKLNSPIVWNEGNRTVNITIVSDIESREVGFSPESGDFEFVDPAIIGKPWPICFGEVIRIPAQRITPRIEATSLTRFFPITNDKLTSLAEKVKKYVLILAELGVTDDILDIENLEISILNDDYIALLQEIAKAYREFTTIFEELIISNPIHEANLKTFIDFIVNIEIKKHQITKISQFINAVLQKQKKNQDEIEDLEDATLTELDKFPFEDEQIIAGIVTALEPIVFSRNGLIILISQLAGLIGNLQDIINDDTISKDALITLMTIFDLPTIDFFSTEPFPQGEMDLIVNKQRFSGTTTDSQFVIAGGSNALDLEPVNMAVRLNSNPNEFWIDNWSTGETPNLRNRYILTVSTENNITQRRVIFVTQQEGNHCYFSPIVFKEGETIDGRITYGFKLFSTGDVIEQQSATFLSEAWVPLLSPAPLNPPDWVTGMYQLMVGDWTLDLGDPISHTSSFNEIHIVNLYESISVDEVLAYREEDGKRILMILPDHYYTIDLAFEISGFTTTAIKLQRPLREYEGENWEDQLYVSLESTLVNNTADIIKWLIETWTDFTVDSASFASVASNLTNFPSNFPLLTKEDAISLIEDIAWQARCAVWIANDVVFIKYLSIEPDVDLNIDEDMVEVSTLQATYTDTEEIVTILEASWQNDYSLPEKNTIILRNNVPIYGVHRESHDIFIYNLEELVQRTLTFWLIRKSNTWRKIIFNGFMNLLELEIFDTVKVNINSLEGYPPVKTVVENVEYDNKNQSIRLTLWLPIRAGFLTVYPFAWMSSAPAGLEYPTADDPHAGGG